MKGNVGGYPSGNVLFLYNVKSIINCLFLICLANNPIPITELIGWVHTEISNPTSYIYILKILQLKVLIKLKRD